MDDKEIKVSKSYSIRPSQVVWLRDRAFQESTPERPVSASALLERIIDEAMKQSEPSPAEKKTHLNARTALAA